LRVNVHRKQYSMKLNANVVGVKALEKKFKKFGIEGQKQFEDITKIQALEIQADAKRQAPVDLGKLRQGIVTEEVNKTTYIIAALEKYSAFMEFGTGMLTSIPKGWEEIAILFKGKGVRQVNLPAQPFLYPAFMKGSDQYIKDLNTALKRLTDKFNK